MMKKSQPPQCDYSSHNNPLHILKTWRIRTRTWQHKGQIHNKSQATCNYDSTLHCQKSILSNHKPHTAFLSLALALWLKFQYLLSDLPKLVHREDLVGVLQRFDLFLALFSSISISGVGVQAFCLQLLTSRSTKVCCNARCQNMSKQRTVSNSTDMYRWL